VLANQRGGCGRSADDHRQINGNNRVPAGHGYDRCVDTTDPNLVRRHLERLLRETLADTPVTVVQGARQVGKSTLVRQVLPNEPLLSLNSAPTLAAAKADPVSFVRQNPDGLLAIDEIQRAPELILAIQDAVEENRRPGRFLITGSANLLNLRGAQESLAGRAETVELFGLSQGELSGRVETFIDRLLAGDGSAVRSGAFSLTRTQYADLICAGSYPEPRLRKGTRRRTWFTNYLNRVLTRDAVDVSGLPHLDQLPRLLRLLAAQSSGELVIARIANDAGIPPSSLRPYLKLLEDLYLIQVLPSWSDNLTRRETDRPKVALMDTGLVARLNNVTADALGPARVSDLAGDLFETFVAGELRRSLGWAERSASLFHFRNRDGVEVDIVIEDDDRNVAGVEVKASATVDGSDFKGLRYLQQRLGDRFTHGVVLYTGDKALPFGERLSAVPLQGLWG
jgi:predicted AAA+ superfamily ATPase